MAWEISISPEGWDEIREALEKWTKDQLIDAIGDDLYEYMEVYGCPHYVIEPAYYELRNTLLQYASHDTLVARAFELIERNNTCDNGGWAYWIDREGHHKVRLPDASDSEE